MAQNYLQDAWDSGVRTWEDLLNKLDEYKDDAQDTSKDAIDAVKDKAKDFSDSDIDFPTSVKDLREMLHL